jgi:hypothetical protein
MNQQNIISELITSRNNTLSVKRIEVVFDSQSLGNPKISVGTLPFYEWNEDKEMTYVITYGRYLNCEMLVYDKEIKKDKDFIIVKGQDKAVKVLTKILSEIKG